MNLKLNRPICFFDLETTGISITKDRIIEISILKIYPNGNKESKTWLVNPQIPIPKESTDIHGITDDKIKNEPTFKQLSNEIKNIIKGCDLGGYNSNKFDIPILMEEMLRVEQDLDLKNVKSIDVLNIFYKKEPRTLEAGYRFYCNKTLKNAHSAEADALATFEILEAQIEKYDDLADDVNNLAIFSTQRKSADFANFIGLDKNENPIFNFGKYKGQKVLDIFEKDKGYYSWIQNADFPLYTKKILTEIKLSNAFKK